MRRWVVTRDERCRFPGCNRPAQLCDIDHITEWQRGGVTDIDNLVALIRPHHRAKTAQLWQQELQQNGSVDWEDPWDHLYTDLPPDPADPAPPHLVEPDPPDDHCPF